MDLNESTATLLRDDPNNHNLVTGMKDSSNPPQQYISLTLNIINQAKYKFAIVLEESKAHIVEEIIHQKTTKYSFAQVHDLIWYLNKAAASK